MLSTARRTAASRSPRSERLAELTGGELLVLEGAGHLPQARESVVVSHAIREVADRFRPAARGGQRTWTRRLNRPTRVLYLSSPIALGHARRDLAIAYRPVETDGAARAAAMLAALI